MISETCPGSKLGRTGKAPGEVRVQKRVNKREPGRHARTESESKGLGTPALNPFRPKSEVVRKVFHRFRSSSYDLPPGFGFVSVERR